MTGPQHYLRAQRLLHQSRMSQQVPGQLRDAQAYAQRALAHAQLAAIAASANIAGLCSEDPDWDAAINHSDTEGTQT